MLGLDLSKGLFDKEVLPLLTRETPEILPLVAIGLVGEGSECFGFDDNTSQDHDFGASLCFWLPEAEMPAYQEKLETVLAKLPQTFQGFPVRTTAQSSQGRCGLMPIEHFYARYMGFKSPPQTWQEWRKIPENYLAVVTNGQIFYDELGAFSAFRKTLLAYYPEDVRLKKITARLAIMSQAGQYNLLRSAKREQDITAMLAVARFAEAALSLSFLLNKQYMPFYKWASTAVKTLPLLGAECFACLEKLSNPKGNTFEQTIEIIEEYCTLVAQVLREQGLSTVQDSWLLAHATEIQAKITAPQLKMLPEMAE